MGLILELSLHHAHQVEAYDGSRTGYVFQMGEQGLGYYPDALYVHPSMLHITYSAAFRFYLRVGGLFSIMSDACFLHT